MSEQLASFIPLILMFVAMWFILIRPAKKRQQQTAQMQNNLQRGDKVVTVGGMHGTIEAIEDTVVHLTVADGVRVKFERQAIGRVITDDVFTK